MNVYADLMVFRRRVEVRAVSAFFFFFVYFRDSPALEVPRVSFTLFYAS